MDSVASDRKELTMGLLTLIRRLREAKEQRIIAALKTHGEMSSYALGETARVWSGALHPILLEMETDGRIVSRWGAATVVIEPHRTRFYRLIGL